jgi:hypothetical protein
MIDAVSWEDLATLASRLDPADQLRLVERIVHDLAAAGEASKPVERRPWRELRGRAAHPLCGEDAQAWVSRGRRESDEMRDAGMRAMP